MLVNNSHENLPIQCICGRTAMTFEEGKYFVKGRFLEISGQGARVKCRCKAWVQVPIKVSG